MEQVINPIEVHVSDDEEKALEKMVVKLKKSKKGYKASVVMFAIIGVLTFLLGVVTIDYPNPVNIAVGILEIILAIFELYMAFGGILISNRLNYRRAISKLNQKVSNPMFHTEGVEVSSNNGKVMEYPWGEFDAYTKYGRCIWLVSDKRFKPLAIYLSLDQIPQDTFEQLPKAFELKGVREIKID